MFNSSHGQMKSNLVKSVCCGDGIPNIAGSEEEKKNRNEEREKN